MAQHTYAINTVACYPKPITSMDDVKQLRVGDTYKTQIALYVRERTQRELDPVTAFRNSVKLSAKTRSLQETLAKLPYISVPLSKKLTAAGCQSLDDLAKDSAVRERLTVQPRKMVPWVDHILQPVTREEAQRFEDLLNEYLQPSGWLVHMTGEWRRGELEAPNVDVLIFHRAFGYIPLPTEIRTKARELEISTMFNNSLWSVLRERGVIADEFLHTYGRWEGMIRLPEREGERWETLYRRQSGITKREGRFCFARVRVFSKKSAGAALLRTTGDNGYARYVYEKAYDLGLHFDDYGLWQFHPNDPTQAVEDTSVVRGRNGHRLLLPKLRTNGYWELLPSDTEQEILAQLDLPYIEPERRNFKNK